MTKKSFLNHSKFSKPKTQNEKIEYFSFSFYHKYNLLIIWILCHIQTQKNIKEKHVFDTFQNQLFEMVKKK